ncbi:MAG: hypothetical protein VYD66_05040 [Candidatus Neomarinimicrobiota bacterium]|nr:hypothetical protein [Candidatus Neomarinimicrobiota bacterium]
MQDNNTSFILDESGDRHFEDRIIWSGYLTHWSGEKIHARELEQHDYENNEPIIILWPIESSLNEPFVDLYYNERLTKYFVSFLGHTAINVNGSIFNFSHLMNENEIMEKEEYFFRPALGEFAPSPNNGLFEILEDGRVFYDKFGRNFMRRIHRIRILGLDTEKMMAVLKKSLDIILNTTPNPKEPDKYKDFNIVSNNCATIIRDVFNQCGFPEIKGRFPRDLFVNTAYHLFCHPELDVQYSTLPQLFVPEAPMSRVSPLLNFWNYFRKNELRIFESS